MRLNITHIGFIAVSKRIYAVNEDEGILLPVVSTDDVLFRCKSKQFF